MSEPKTVPTDSSVEDFLNGVADEGRRTDCRAVVDLMREITGEEPRIWGPSIIGFGCYHYVYESGREGEWFVTGVAPRKQALTLYVMAGFGRYDELMGRLGKFKTGKSCLYIKRLDDVDPAVLRELIAASVAHVRERWSDC